MWRRASREEDSTVFVMPAEPPHSVTNHVASDPEGILDSIASAMSTIAHNNAVCAGHCAVVLGPEHARVIGQVPMERAHVKTLLPMVQLGNKFGDDRLQHRYGKVYNRSLPKWYKREPDAPSRALPSPDHIHLFCIGGDAGRFSAFIPGWGHMARRCCARSTARPADDACVDGSCKLSA